MRVKNQTTHRGHPSRQRAAMKRGRQQRHFGCLSPQFLPIVVSLLIGASLLPSAESFASFQSVESSLYLSKIIETKNAPSVSVLKASLSDDDEYFGHHVKNNRSTETRREILSNVKTTAAAWFVTTAASTMGTLVTYPSKASATPEDDIKELRALIEKAKIQLDSVPPLLKAEKWDSVRVLLTEAPLRDCWSKSTPILKKYANALGDTPKGDELAALEGREELLQQLRFLDMAVYNNVFNPIATEGQAGASKVLIDSYYNDPRRAFEASMKAIEDLIELSN